MDKVLVTMLDVLHKLLHMLTEPQKVDILTPILRRKKQGFRERN